MAPSITFDNVQTDEASKELARRSALMKAMVPLIANRLAVAQQRDKLRYAQISYEAYLPLIRKFSVGDYVSTLSKCILNSSLCALPRSNPMVQSQ